MNGLWAEIDKFEMILAWNINGMVDYKCRYGIVMCNDFMLV